MSFGGLKKAEDRVNLIVYLNEADGSPVELAAAAGAESAETEVAAAAETMTEPTTETTTEPTTEPTAETATETETVATATEGEPETTTAASGGGDFAELLAAADAEAGKKVFRKCKACHKLEEGRNAVGPSLFGIVGRDIGSGARFNYSDAMKGVEGDWTLANLDAFLTKPKAFAPGNKMSFPGLKKAQDRIDVITFLNEADGSPEPLQ
jgi:cytochrome c2